MKFLRLILSTTVLLAACGGPEGPVDYSHDPGDLILRIEDVGGFQPPEVIWRRLPDLSIYGDGQMIFPRSDFDSNPALPPLVTSRLDDDDLQSLLRKARDAGLMRGNRRFTTDDIADASTTVITIAADGRRHRTSVYALGFERDRNTRRIADFVEETRKLLDAQDAEQFAPDRIQVIALAESSASEIPWREPDGDKPRAAWPLATPLQDLGGPFDDPSGFGVREARCAVIAGNDITLLRAALETATNDTLWMSNDVEFIAVFRPLLPDEKGCA